MKQKQSFQEFLPRLRRTDSPSPFAETANPLQTLDRTKNREREAESNPTLP
jgi:hypothetical protein